ncbi:MAG TPA: spore germination protein GerW family protein [Bryobacteraceae bacterium]|nr:spore germination protein GerW family protein [Bryobacteraceae bacterium]
MAIAVPGVLALYLTPRQAALHRKDVPGNLQSLIEPLSKSATAKSVFGEPITASGKTIIPVARVAYGFGGGGGRRPHETSSGEGEGGGGGVYAVPLGVIEVTEAQTRFVALNEKRKLVAAILVGLGIGAFLGRRS